MDLQYGAKCYYAIYMSAMKMVYSKCHCSLPRGHEVFLRSPPRQYVRSKHTIFQAYLRFSGFSSVIQCYYAMYICHLLK